jgi:lipocalin
MSWSKGDGLKGALALAWMMLAAAVTPSAAQVASPPTAVQNFPTSSLVGDWYEVLGSAPWALRRCVTDTRHRFVADGRRALRVSTWCTTPRGVELRRGRVKGPPSGDGRLRLRYAPVVFAWVPAAWTDFWVLADSGDGRWVLVGDRQRQSVSLLAREVAIDEAAVARALAAARAIGYDVGRFRVVPQPSGGAGLFANR